MTNFFCHLPFVAIQTNGQTAKPCCVWSGPDMPLDGYDKNPQLLNAKKQLFKGEAPTECKKCVLEEANSGKSFRTLANQFHPHLSQEVLAETPSYSCIKQVNVVGSNVCNLMCLPCTNSSYKRSKELYDIGIHSQMPIHLNISNLEEIIKLENLEQIVLCSGEPFYDKNSLRLLDLLIKTGQSRNLRLDINTNLTAVSRQQMDYLVENFNQVLIKGSIDGIYGIHEYLRYPSSWQEIHQAVDMLLSIPKIHFVILTALSNLSLLGYVDLVRYFLNLGVEDFFISSVTNPKALHNANLPRDLKHQTLKNLIELKNTAGITAQLINCIDACINICQNDHQWDSQLLADFMQRHDDVRGTNWRNTWPSLAEFC
jgi:sulfatase maturation enzyme AslB (radical SAM superfamily)